MFALGLIAMICSFRKMRSVGGDVGCTSGVVK